jgi:hypothetical protein
MANIKVTLDYPIHDGMDLTFKAPCDCTAVTGLKVYYPSLNENTSTETSKTFTFKDTHGVDLNGIGNLFMANAYVKVILDTVNNHAYIQNADTNSYLESKFGNSGGGTITGVSANGTSIATSGVANIPAATTSKYGVTKLSSSTSSTSTTLAATSSAVKSVKDSIPTKTSQLTNDSGFLTSHQDISGKLDKSGGTMTGKLTAQNNTSYTTKQVRNAFLIKEGSSLPSGASGDLCFVYKA